VENGELGDELGLDGVDRGGSRWRLMWMLFVDVCLETAKQFIHSSYSSPIVELAIGNRGHPCIRADASCMSTV
jgi:hypothetical protein